LEPKFNRSNPLPIRSRDSCCRLDRTPAALTPQGDPCPWRRLLHLEQLELHSRGSLSARDPHDWKRLHEEDRGTDHVDRSAGGATVNGATVNVTGPLLPAGFPGSKLAWVATAVYCPVDRAGLALLDAQPAPVPVAVVSETIVPFAVAPAWIWTVTGVMSLAVPVKDGVMLLDGDWGEVNVTVGAAGTAVVT